MTHRTRRTGASVLVLASMALAWARPADARITKIVVTRTQSPTFGGATFGAVGRYEKLAGRASGEVDPADPRNALIADIRDAPRNARRMVEYETDILILRPLDRARGNHRVFFEINNRGSIRSLSAFNDPARESNDPSDAEHAGNGFLMRQGYTIVLSGWDVTARPGAGRLTMTVPIARERDGSAIVGPSLEEFVIDNATTMMATLTYPAATREKSGASLTRRALYSDAPVTVPPAGWEWVDDRTIRLLPAGTPFQNGYLYEFTYQARDPLVAGLAFAGVRDLAAYIHHESGAANPLAGDVQRVYAFGLSQPTRFLHDFLTLGFNEDEQGRTVFDGMLNWIGGPSGGFFNYRFAQPGRTHRQHIGRWFPEFQFPFAYPVTRDPATGRSDGRLRRCLASNTCPKIFEVNSENEYWAKAMSLMHVDDRGQDLPDPPNVRLYLLASLPHAAGVGPGVCQQPRNPIRPNPTLRALQVALDDWVTTNKTPPDSRVPRVADGSLVPPLPQGGVGFPGLPGVTYNGRLHTVDRYDFGRSFAHGILTRVPPKLIAASSPLVPRTDSDGNNLAGVRQVEVAAPLATYTGWALRSGPPAGDGCDAFGQQIDFPSTRAERLDRRDPRLSLEERYPTRDNYVRTVKEQAARLELERFLLHEDVIRYVEAASRSAVRP